MGKTSIDVGTLVAEEETIFKGILLESNFPIKGTITFAVTAHEFGHPGIFFFLKNYDIKSSF